MHFLVILFVIWIIWCFLKVLSEHYSPQEQMKRKEYNNQIAMRKSQMDNLDFQIKLEQLKALQNINNPRRRPPPLDYTDA